MRELSGHTFPPLSCRVLNQVYKEKKFATGRLPATYQMLRAIQKTCCTRTLETLTLKSHLIDPFFVCVDRMNPVVHCSKQE
jgi:hypothetical protein